MFKYLKWLWMTLTFQVATPDVKITKKASKKATKKVAKKTKK